MGAITPCAALTCSLESLEAVLWWCWNPPKLAGMVKKALIPEPEPSNENQRDQASVGTVRIHGWTLRKWWTGILVVVPAGALLCI